MPMKSKKLLMEEFIEETVKAALSEQDGGDYGDLGVYGGDYGGYGGGGDTSSSGQLYKTFIQPFVDVGKTLAYGIERLSAQTQTVVKGILAGLPTLFIPGLEYDYKQFRAEEAEKVNKIKERYKEVLGRNWEALQSNDAFGFAFLLEPSVVLGANLALKAPEIALSILDILSGGYDRVREIARQFHVPVGFRGPGETGTNPSGEGGGKHHFSEQAINKKQLGQAIQNLLKDKNLAQRIDNNPVVKQGRQDAINLSVDRVKQFMAAKTYDELMKLAPNAVGKVTAAVAQNEKQGKMAPQEDANAKAVLVPQLKQQFKDFYIKKLNDEAKGDPTLKPFVQNAVKQIQALK